MQMPNATPQGLAGLMQQRPQAPQMPTPGKASPMAGLGGVDDRVSAYQGNTKPLEQRYAMSQDLLDLLALQKIKSQKDAAARQMQLQMAQQGAEGGQANMTVAQQREQEVDALTKNELAEQRGDTAQKQAGDQQAMMQKMMGGIAGAPGANAAAQPKAMAAGGIVGYAGPEGSSVEDPRRKRLEGESTQDYRRRMFELELQIQRDKNAAVPIDREAERQRRLRERGEIIPPSPLLDRASLPKSPAQVAAEAELAKREQTQDRPTVAPETAVPPADKLPPANVVAAATQGEPKPPAPPAAPKPPAPPGIAGLPGAAPAAGPAVGPANDFGKKLEAAALKNAEIDPAARQLSEEKRIEERMALSPDQRKVYEEGIGGLQKMYNEQYDPERQRNEGLKRALIGAGGRRYGEFAGAATAGMNYDDQQRAAKLKEFGDVQNARTGLIGIDRANVKEGIAGGQKAYEQGSLSQRQGLESGSRLYNTDVESSNKALDREIDKLKIAATNSATAATREGLSYDKARTIYSATLGRVQELERKIDDDFATRNSMLLMQEQTGKLDPAQKNQLETAKIQLQQQKAKLRKELEPVLESARQKLGVTGVGSSDGFGDMKKVDSKK